VFSLHVDTARTWRGGQHQVLLTVLGLRALGHRAALVAHPDGELRKRAAEGHDLFLLAPGHEMDLKAAWQLARLIRRLSPDIVHAHDPHAVAMAAQGIAFLPANPRPPLVAARRVDFRIRRHAFSKWKYRQVSCFICASALVRQVLVAGGLPPDRLVVVHEGIDIDHVQAVPSVDARAEFWLPRDAPVIGNVGALVPHKGQKYLVEAAPLVRREVPDARFVILGDGELAGSLARQIHDLKLEKHVILGGFRPDVLSLMKSFDLFAMPSVTEGLGTAILDAMACGLAVAASRTGGIPEVVVHGETGLLVPPEDPAALARAIVALLSDERLRAMLGQRGRERVRSGFGADRMVRETLTVYERVARPAAAATSAPPS
jgi:glycosyltransferase involved in cell wall biosynthesis